MTNAEFNEFVESNFRTARGNRSSRTAAAEALGIDRDTVNALCDGVTRRGTAFPVRPLHSLAAKAWITGIRA